MRLVFIALQTSTQIFLFLHSKRFICIIQQSYDLRLATEERSHINGIFESFQKNKIASSSFSICLSFFLCLFLYIHFSGVSLKENVMSSAQSQECLSFSGEMNAIKNNIREL